MSYLIAAVDANLGLGLNNNLPWKETDEGKKDMAFFRKQTRNSAILMGYNTWKSIGRPLPGRLNIIVTKRHYDEMKLYIDTYNKPNTSIEVFNDLKKAVLFALDYENKTNKCCYICGGGEIYKQYLKMFIPKIIYLTKFTKNYNCDVFFPIEYLEKYTEHNLCKITIDDDIFYTYRHCTGGCFYNLFNIPPVML